MTSRNISKKCATLNTWVHRGVNRRHRRKSGIYNFCEKLLVRNRAALSHVTALLFTGTIFLGGSYLFFVQLAEYGW